MEIRNAKLSVNKSGGTASKGAKTYRITLPNLWIEEMGLGENSRDIELKFSGKSIIICPKLSLEEFAQNKKENSLIKLEYYNSKTLCTVIVADYTDKEIFIENKTDYPLYLAFGKNDNPNWEDYLSFLESRCISKDRDRLRNYLEAMKLEEFNPLEIIKKTQGRMAEDQQWIRVTEL